MQRRGLQVLFDPGKGRLDCEARLRRCRRRFGQEAWILFFQDLHFGQSAPFLVKTMCTAQVDGGDIVVTSLMPEASAQLVRESFMSNTSCLASVSDDFVVRVHGLNFVPANALQLGVQQQGRAAEVFRTVLRKDGQGPRQPLKLLVRGFSLELARIETARGQYQPVEDD